MRDVVRCALRAVARRSLVRRPMTTLIVSLPPRPRLGPQAADPSGLRAADRKSVV